MAYRFKQEEAIPDGIRRIVVEEATAAAESLQNGTGSKRDESIHEARKGIEKIRGLLKLVRFEIGKSYRDANSTLREIGRGLSAVRDAGALIESFDATLSSLGSKARTARFAAIRRGLFRDKQEQEKVATSSNLVENSGKALLAFGQQVREWPLDSDAFTVLATGLKDSYKRGRKAMKVAEQSGDADRYHLWRKRAKEHWYHTRLMEPAWTKVFEAREEAIHELEQALGEDHNLAVLQGRLLENPERYGREAVPKEFLQHLAARRTELRACAHALGARIYATRATAVTESYERLWDAWRAEAHGKKRMGRAQEKRTGRTARKKNAA